MKINKDHQIINSLRISSHSKYNFLIENHNDCHELYDFIRLKRLPYIVIGEGTNIVTPEYFNGIVIQTSLNTINNDKHLNVGASANWNELVEFTIKNNIYGFENLSLIPGSVGAAPVQNIGAYGVEISSLIKSVECFDLSNNSFITINGNDCNFKYRHSCFKDNPDLLILSVNFFNNFSILSPVPTGTVDLVIIIFLFLVDLAISFAALNTNDKSTSLDFCLLGVPTQIKINSEFDAHFNCVFSFVVWYCLLPFR